MNFSYKFILKRVFQ